MNTIIEKIRAEVNRLKEEGDIALQDAVETNDIESGFVCGGIISTCEKLLTKLDTLKEQPVCEGLEEVSEALAEQHGFVKNPSCKPAKYSWSAVRDVFIEGVIAGARWQKEQLMKEAVEVEVTETCGIASVWIKTKQFKPGQKVPVIIVKDD